jgi:hypothetical protein
LLHSTTDADGKQLLGQNGPDIESLLNKLETGRETFDGSSTRQSHYDCPTSDPTVSESNLFEDLPEGSTTRLSHLSSEDSLISRKQSSEETHEGAIHKKFKDCVDKESLPAVDTEAEMQRDVVVKWTCVSDRICVSKIYFCPSSNQG